MNNELGIMNGELKRPLLLDLFCGAGGCSMGYVQAGFDVIGVDIQPQPHYPFPFVQADALVFLRMLIASGGIDRFAVVHASPPCQAYSVTKSMHNNDHPDLVDETRRLLVATGKNYVIENVPGAPLENPLMLCGTMFNLRVIRHRLFESKPPIWFPPAICKHDGRATSSSSTRRPIGGTTSLSQGFKFVTVCGNDYLADEGRMAMGIDWMPKSRLSQAIPPAYTQYIGEKLMAVMNNE